MNYQIEIEKPAAIFIHKLPKQDRERNLVSIKKLPDEGDIKALQGKKSKGYSRLRVGEYRIIFTVDQGLLIVRVVDAGNRGQIYNKY